MAAVLLIGTDASLLEGLAQALASAGHAVHLADSVGEAVEVASHTPPLVVVADHQLGRMESALTRLAAPGGALLLYHTGSRSVAPLTPALQRAVMAELALPLERHRLVALIHRVAERVEASGRGRTDAPPEPERRAT